MGCGKSTLGRKVAQKLNLQFIDMDEYLESRFHKTVPQIFSEEGEEAFRQKERKVLEELSEFTGVVVATGGGAPCFFDNMDLMNRTGETVFFDIDPQILALRLKRSKTIRPLIQGKQQADLVPFVKEMLEKRRPFYEKAKYRILNPEIKPDEIIAIIRGEA
jgi:shikimate kinase